MKLSDALVRARNKSETRLLHKRCCRFMEMKEKNKLTRFAIKEEP